MKTISAGEETFMLHCKAYRLNPEREYVFHPGRRFRFDFAFPSHRLAVEVDGGTWQIGRHQTAVGFAKDCEKFNLATLDGWRVLRYTTDMVKQGTAIEHVMKMLTLREYDHTPAR